MKISTRQRLVILLAGVGLEVIAGIALASNCAVTSVGLTPLEALGPGTYNGSQGGLYPGGSNSRPAAHDADLASVAAPIPLDAAGNPDPVNGKIGFISCGMSNATQEFSTFKPLADAYPDKNPKLVIVDCAVGGKTASIIMNPADPYWANCDSRLTAAGLTNAQVEVVWLKEADANPSSTWPTYAQTLRDEMGTILQVLKARYPNTRSAYLSNRIYAGYASSTLNPEPYAYETGFTIKWLVEEQLAGDPRYNFDPAKGSVLAPWIAWARSLWADGLTPRPDGLTWECADLTPNDGTHPDIPGRKKVAKLLLDFFRSDATTVPWFLSCTGSTPSEVQGLKLRKQPWGTELLWSSQDATAGAATVYDTVSGTIDSLHALGNFERGTCLAADVADTPYVNAVGPVMHLKFDEGSGTAAADSSGYNNNGLVSNATWTAGQLAGGLQFNGTSSIVTVPSSASLSPLSQLTVALWAQPDALGNGVLAAKWISGSDETWMFRVRPDGTLLVNIVPSLTDSTYNNAGGTVAPVVTAGTWHHLAFVYDGARASDAERLKIYVDGVAQTLAFSTGGIPAVLTSGVAPVSVGLGADNIRAYSGVLDDPHIYGRALSDAEIQALASGSAPGSAIWYRERARNSCGAGSWGDPGLDGGAVACP